MTTNSNRHYCVYTLCSKARQKGSVSQASQQKGGTLGALHYLLLRTPSSRHQRSCVRSSLCLLGNVYQHYWIVPFRPKAGPASSSDRSAFSKSSTARQTVQSASRLQTSAERWSSVRNARCSLQGCCCCVQSKRQSSSFLQLLHRPALCSMIRSA